jgi:hypothetical protein
MAFKITHNALVTPNSYDDNVPPPKPFTVSELINHFRFPYNIPFIRYCLKNTIYNRDDTSVSIAAVKTKVPEIFILVIEFGWAVSRKTLLTIGISLNIEFMKQVFDVLCLSFVGNGRTDMQISIRDDFMDGACLVMNNIANLREKCLLVIQAFHYPNCEKRVRVINNVCETNGIHFEHEPVCPDYRRRIYTNMIHC